eukprot:4745284-Pyramimonas_sp.AAC.1
MSLVPSLGLSRAGLASLAPKLAELSSNDKAALVSAAQSEPDHLALGGALEDSANLEDAEVAKMLPSLGLAPSDEIDMLVDMSLDAAEWGNITRSLPEQNRPLLL